MPVERVRGESARKRTEGDLDGVPLAYEGVPPNAGLASRPANPSRLDAEYERRVSAVLDNLSNRQSGREKVVEDLRQGSVVEADSTAHAVPEAGRVRVPAALDVDGMNDESAVRRSFEARPVEARLRTDEDELALRRQDACRFSDQRAGIGNVGVDEGDVDGIDLAVVQGQPATVAHGHGVETLPRDANLLE